MGGGIGGQQLILTNKGSTTCTLQGYPQLQLLDTKGQPAPTTILYHYANPTTKKIVQLTTPPSNTALVGVPPGKTAVLGIERDRCSFGVAGSNLSGNQVIVTLPNNGEQLTVPLAWSTTYSNCDTSTGVRISAFAYPLNQP